MKRIVALCLVLLVSCTPSEEGSAEEEAIASADTAATAEPTPTPTTTPSPVKTLAATPACDGLGRPRQRGEVTFIRDDRLVAVTPDGEHERCLADLSDSRALGAPGLVSWNGPADRVIVGDRALSKDLSETSALTEKPYVQPLWSRPSGTSVIYVTEDGRLMKRSSFGGRAIDISFLARHDDVTYHPAGEHIATTGLAEDGSYGLYLATNLGTDEKLLARGEAARFITDLVFAQSGRELYYTARHGPNNWHLHRLTIGKNALLETLDKNEFGFYVAVSEVEEFPPFVWSSSGDCAAGEPDRLHVTVGDGFEIPAELERTSLRPVGWLPDRTLVVTSSPVSCSVAAPQDIYVFHRNKEPVLIAREVGESAAVRAVLLPPPPPPGEEQEVVA